MSLVFLLFLHIFNPSGQAAVPSHPARHFKIRVNEEDPLRAILDAGRRNLKWLNQVNTARASKRSSVLDLSSASVIDNIIPDSPQTPESPLRYNGEILLKQFRQLLAQAPRPFVQRVTGRANLSADQAGMKDSSFLNWVATLDFIYGYACRWVMSQDTLDSLSADATNDLRGYLFLTKDKNPEVRLQNYYFQPVRVQRQIFQALLQLCRNSQKTSEECFQELSDPSGKIDAPLRLFQKYLPFGQKIWNSHFEIQNPRSDIVWTSDQAEVATLRFYDPGTPALKAWLKEKIESAWKVGSWSLKIVFDSGFRRDIPHLLFAIGVTPTTDSVGGSIITLDQNMPLDQEDSISTIQHEFGHVLGFPDCYVEFYDSSEKMMITYSLSEKNLMCNDQGHVLQSHYQELKRVYFRE
ncbi:MAG: hypothetical protein H7333_10495 [Bdellovibrionales bacterium]|nr:hypothetical protein [Oligoflexia bacterium]